jgi:hypothetical protein
MAKDLQPNEEYDDGLAPPPALPPLATSQTGTVAQAEALQQKNSVPDRLRGPWFHGTYTDLKFFDNQHEEWTWFTRSPTGGTIWGKDVRLVYVIGVPENTKLHGTSNKGDTNGYDGDDALPDWWMGVGREDIPKLMVVLKIDSKTEKVKLDGFMATEWYKAMRQTAIDKVQAAKKP